MAVLLPPVSYAYSSAARLMTALLEALADRGLQAILLDHRGTGDSLGDLTTQAAAQADVEHLVSALVESGAVVTLVGLEWGGTLARAVRADGLVSAVALAPVANGRRWVRQLQLLGERDESSGALSVGGYLLPAAFLEDLTASPPPEDPPHPFLHVAAADADAFEGTSWTSAGLRLATESAAEDAEVDLGLVAAVADWVVASTPAHAPRTAPLPLTPAIQAAGLREQTVTLGPHGLPGWLTSGERSTGLLVLLNSGSDPHTGPGRAWVDLARGLAAAGGPAVLRFDARGWGRTPLRWGSGRPYAQSMIEDCEQVLTALRPDADLLAVGGLCAGAWNSLDVARRLDVEHVIAVNAQLYWEPGDPVEARIADTIARREPEAQAIARAREQGRWDREDAAGQRNRAGQWLDDLAARPVRVELVFTGDDPGLRYLQDRLAARLADVQAKGAVSITRLPDLDHGLQRSWLRPQLTAAVLTALGQPAPAG